MIAQQSLKNKAITGMIWNSIDKIAIKGVAFVIGIILARILMPADYGLIGMLAIFIAFSDMFVGGGLSMALIQKTDRTDVDYSTIFHFNLIVGLICYLILFFSAPLIAQFFNAPQLAMLTRVLSLIIIINALAIVQQTRLTIKLDFKTQALISLFSVVIGGAIGLFMAYRGFGVWALVSQTLSSSLVRAASLFYFNKWMPMLTFSVASFKQLFGFSSKLLGAGLVATVVNNLYSILIGKIFAAKDLGFYTKAKEYPEFLSATLSMVLQGVTFPILASLQNDRIRMVSVYGRIMGIIVFFVIPTLTLFALLSEPFVRIFLTEKWMPVVPLIQWMCFARMITPISSLNMTILNAIGRSDLYFWVDISKLPLTLATLTLTIPLGLTAIVIGHFATSFICYFINAYYPGKLFGFGAVRQIKEMWRVICATLFMSMAVFISMILLPSDLLKLLISAPLGIGVYIIAAYLLKIKEFSEVYEIIQPFIKFLRRGT
ncbi:MAG: lipopolysaccharide biosynthesis protein [Proteobacteria bacterium]|nr:lipopolysaccharide biosynthesis protein [Pseudomonadota bacterium]